MEPHREERWVDNPPEIHGKAGGKSDEFLLSGFHQGEVMEINFHQKNVLVSTPLNKY